MARIKCICGENLSNSSNPEIEYDVFSESEYLELVEKSEKELGAVMNYGNPKLSFWKCYSCNRLIFFEANNDTPIQWYRPEVTNNNQW